MLSFANLIEFFSSVRLVDPNEDELQLYAKDSLVQLLLVPGHHFKSTLMLISSQIWSSIPTIGKIKQENTYQLSEAITNCAAELKFNKGKSKSIELAFDFFESYNFSDGTTYVDATKTNAEEIYKTLCLDYNVGLIEGINYDAVAHFNGILYKVPSNKWFGEDADSFEGFNLQSPFKFVYIPLDNVNYRKPLKSLNYNDKYKYSHIVLDTVS